MTTSAMPYQRGTAFGTVEARFDFIEHQLLIETNDGRHAAIALQPQSVAEFYRKFMDALAELGVVVKIWTTPCEIPDPTPFEKDHAHASYDREAMHTFWRIMVWVDQVLKEFRAGFLGKVSPVHFFWGSFDLAVTRFSGRRAPERPGADPITREAYSHEVSSAGFWPGGPGVDAFFYSYAYPEPKGFREYKVGPAEAKYDEAFGEFVLPYEAMRTAADPDAALLEFLQSTYEAAASLGKWDRAALEVASTPTGASA
jgi:hypothetical protein